MPAMARYGWADGKSCICQTEAGHACGGSAIYETGKAVANHSYLHRKTTRRTTQSSSFFVLMQPLFCLDAAGMLSLPLNGLAKHTE